MDRILGFFKQKKLDVKFKQAGEGHKLSEEKKQPEFIPKNKDEPWERKPPSNASMTAGAAALQRLESVEKPITVKPKLGVSNTSAVSRTTDNKLSFSGAGHHLEDKSRIDSSRTVSTQSSQKDSSSEQVTVKVITTPFSVQVLMVCPICKLSIAHTNILVHMAQCLQEEYLKEPFTASVQMIHTLTSNEDKKTACVNTIVRYIDNVLSHPGEEKFRKIRAGNKAFKERVESVNGGLLFLEAVGFVKKMLPIEDAEELFYVLPEEKASCSDNLVILKEMLTTAEKLVPQLDRNPQLLVPSGNVDHFDLADEFYNVSVDEIRKEQKLRSEAIEQASVLRTKAMREKDELKSAVKYYRFILLRIRFPEDVILQGVFKPMETLSAVREFISNCLFDACRQYKLSFMRNQLTDDNNRLAEIGLAPAAMLSLQWKGGEDYLGFPVEQIFKPAVYGTLKT